MATLVETGVTVSVVITRGPEGDRAVLTAASHDAAGTTIRLSGSIDVTGLVPQARLTSLLDSAEAFAKARYEIP